MAFTLASTAFRDGAAIPVKYTCDGVDVSPPLSWSGAPAGTRGFALMVDDPDAPAGSWVHWVLYNLPADVFELPENIAKVESLRVPVALALMGAMLGSRSQLPAPRSPIFSVVILPADLRGLMSALWVENNRHWDELADQNTLTQLLGTGKP